MEAATPASSQVTPVSLLPGDNNKPLGENSGQQTCLSARVKADEMAAAAARKRRTCSSSLVFDAFVFVLFAVYTALAFYLVFPAGLMFEREAKETPFREFSILSERISLSDLRRVNVTACLEFGIKRSYYNMFGINNLTLSEILGSLSRHESELPASVNGDNRLNFDAVLESSPAYASAHERLLAVLNRPNTSVLRSRLSSSSSSESVGLPSTSFLRRESFADLQMDGADFKRLLAPLAAASGAADEEDLVVSVDVDGADSLSDAYAAAIQRDVLFSDKEVCHELSLVVDGDGVSSLQLVRDLNLVRGARAVFDLERYDFAKDGNHKLTLTVAVGSSSQPAPRWVSLWPQVGRSTQVRITLTPDFGDFTDDGHHEVAGEGRSARPVEEASISLEADVSVTGDRALDPSSLTRFERCRQLRQLSRRCADGDPRRAGLTRAYPVLCDAVRWDDFFARMRFSSCVDGDEGLWEGHSQARDRALDAYMAENAAALEFEFAFAAADYYDQNLSS